MTFPLPLVPFEKYLLADDRADYPMNFFYRMTFRGTLDRRTFQAALEAAQARHPLLGALLGRSPSGRPQWVSAGDRKPQIRWEADDHWDTRVPFTPIDLTQEVGLRVCAGEVEDRTVVLFQFHHVACDGLGAMRFLEDVLAAYHAVLGGGDPEQVLRSVEPERLRQRGKFGDSLVKWLFHCPRKLMGLIGYGLLGTYEYFAHRVITLPSPAGVGQHEGSPNGSACRQLAAYEHTFTEAETATLRKIAKAMRCTTNDLLLRDLYLALGDWVDEHDPSKRSSYLRIMIPTSLRGGSDQWMPATNRVSMIFLDRRPDRLSPEGNVLDTLQKDMKAVKNYDLGLALLYGIRVASHLPGGLKSMLPADQCLSTAVFTNVLDPTLRFPLPRRQGKLVVGDSVLEKLEGFAPLRPKTRAAFGAMLYAGRLMISVSCDPAHFDARRGQELLDRYIRQLRISLDEADQAAQVGHRPFAVRRSEGVPVAEKAASREQ